ncbi:MAG: hypothetical protein IAC42_03160 [Spirochaetes bacterium]|uniref:Uncharacterized protein n=1 Tax=Candidatus Aphodenecus pullistercoris TaxID=2840669 RepID=A0A9D9HAI0_9SPIR|nr:hypothetical protein [Candidatus Aphodenecus pullistercoris]
MRLLAILLLALPMPLWAAIWQSNALMQPLAVLEGEPDGGWWIVEEGSQRRLYYEGQLVATEDRSDGTLVRSGVDTEVTITFSGGRPVDEVREDGTRLSYTYRADGTLDSILTTHSDGTSSLTVYDFSPITGLSAVWRIDGDGVWLFSADTVAWKEEDGYHSVELTALQNSGDALASGEAQVGEDGSVSLVEETDEGILTSVYNPSMRLSSRTLSGADGLVIWREDYEYDSSGDLFFMSRSADGRRVDSYYVDGDLVQSVSLASGLVEEVRIHLQDGRQYVEYYRQGEPYARVLYDLDGLRVISLEML